MELSHFVTNIFIAFPVNHVLHFFTLAAMTAGLPFLNLYMNKDADFSHGVNFVVAGSTAMSMSSLIHDHILSTVTNLRYNFNGCLSISNLFVIQIVFLV